MIYDTGGILTLHIAPKETYTITEISQKNSLTKCKG
jgi:hypothetical protein